MPNTYKSLVKNKRWQVVLRATAKVEKDHILIANAKRIFFI